ncbi:MAG: sulfate ABC transporter substrate-binding protein [Isosphaerales bacterium]
MTRWTASIGLLAVALVFWGTGASSVNRDTTDTLAIGAYSVVRDVVHDSILPAFARHWERKTGRKVRFEESYNGSGAQARAIASGFDADVAILSLEGDIDKLVKAGLIRKDWNAGPHHGIITRSLVVIGYRPGNPAQIRDWEDLTKPGVGVVYPDPKTSGGARWNINAIFGAGLFRAGRSQPDREAARDLLARVQANVITMDASGRQSIATFDRGTGDAIVTYENELLLQAKIERRVPAYAIPPETLLIEGPAAVVDASVVRHGNREVAQAFLDYLRSTEAQRFLAEYGFRPLDPALETNPEREPLPPRLFTMHDLGGWGKNKIELFETGGVWDSLFTGRTRNGGGR